jgi:hypothetical protein
MERKKASFRAKKAEAALAAAAASPNVASPADGSQISVSSIPAPKVRKPTGAAAHKKNRKPSTVMEPLKTESMDLSGRKMSEYETFQQLADPNSPSGSGRGKRRPAPSALPLDRPVRKVSEYEVYQQLSSPRHSETDTRRPARVSAIKARRGFSQMDDDDNPSDMDSLLQSPSTDAPESIVEEDSAVEDQISKQFDSEYDHYQALTSPIPGATGTPILGKRKRKPVINLAEAMRIEAGEEDDDEEEDDQ